MSRGAGSSRRRARTRCQNSLLHRAVAGRLLFVSRCGGIVLKQAGGIVPCSCIGQEHNLSTGHLVASCSSRPERSHRAVAGRLPLVVRCGGIVPSPAFLVVLDPLPPPLIFCPHLRGVARAGMIHSDSTSSDAGPGEWSALRIKIRRREGSLGRFMRLRLSA